MPLMLCVIYYFGNDSSIISLLLCLLFNTFLFDVYILGYNSKGDMILYNGDKEIKIEVKDESYSYEAIMGEDILNSIQREAKPFLGISTITSETPGFTP